MAEPKKSKNKYERIELDNDFDANNHYYPRVINATIHPLVLHFLNLGNKRIINRYCHLHPMVDPKHLAHILEYQPRWFAWAGADLFHVTTAEGTRRMVVIETNSCPSGQKSMPLIAESQEQNGYRLLLEKTAKVKINAKTNKEDGALAVIYDKNYMEASGYAQTLCDVMEEPVHLVSFYLNDPKQIVRFTDDGWMEVNTGDDAWVRVRAAFRYVTQKPWNRLPIASKTLIINPVLSCLAGGRNKLMAAKAYEIFNAEVEEMNLQIHTPETIRDVRKAEIPLWVERFGGNAVVKVPYGNAGQGVYTITNQGELDEFMAEDASYDQYIVQSLIGNYNWSSKTSAGQFYHVGTIANKKNQIYVADLRMMISAGTGGWEPLIIYGRKSHKPLVRNLQECPYSSWDMLGTNLSIKKDDGWDTDTTRLCLMDRRDFNQLGIGIDDLCEAYIQTVLSAIAIDKMACRLYDDDLERFNVELFSSMNNDPHLLEEILVAPNQSASAALAALAEAAATASSS
eukprot:TRINITY_DN328_c0_g2_i6.p2 TRINITY_DN328_c0_g2~~TRINITY_DN328_c0_g2_i6.p2  ORF type:complete len:529 (+),score=238.91 TRINITY_DN328_c0_g2_i6:53-1588(+)